MKRMRVVAAPMDMPLPGLDPAPQGDPAPTEEDLQRMLEEGGPEGPATSALAVLWSTYLSEGGSPYGELKVADINGGQIYIISQMPDDTAITVTPIKVVHEPDYPQVSIIPNGADGKPDWGYISTSFFPSGPIVVDEHGALPKDEDDEDENVI